MTPVELVDLVIASDLGMVGGVGTSVHLACVRAGVSEPEAAEVELAVVEAINNAIEHAYGMDPAYQVHVRLWRQGDELGASITDSGRAMPAGALQAVPDELPIDVDRPELLPEGGMGLFLMRQLMHEIRYETDGHQNTMTLVRRLGTSQAAEGR